MSDRPTADVSGLDYLQVTQTTFNTFTVASRRNDTLTAHRVDISEPTCTCEDFKYADGDTPSCAHIYKVCLVTEAEADTEQHLMRFVSDRVDRVEEAAQSVEQTATSIEAYQQSDDTQASAEPTTEETYEHTPGVEDVRQWLASHDVPVGDGVDVYEHSEYGSIQIDQTGYLDDDEFNALREATDAAWVSYDGDADINFIAPDMLEEVPDA